MTYMTPTTPDSVGDATPAAVVQTYFRRLFDDRDVSVCDELLAPGYIDHDAPDDSPPGPAPTKAYVQGMLDDNPDLVFTIDDLLGDGLKIALRATWKGTRHDGSSWQQTGLVLIHLDGFGRLAERWSAYAPSVTNQHS